MYLFPDLKKPSPLNSGQFIKPTNRVLLPTFWNFIPTQTEKIPQCKKWVGLSINIQSISFDFFRFEQEINDEVI